jgi:hypothetical protein
VSVSYKYHDRSFANHVANLPLGLVVTDYRKPFEGELFINNVTPFGTEYKAAEKDFFMQHCAILTDHRPEIARIYGKPADQLTAPEGYEFTGEFRAGREGEYVLGGHYGTTEGKAIKMFEQFPNCDRSNVKPRLILKPIEKKSVETRRFESTIQNGVYSCKEVPVEQLELDLSLANLGAGTQGTYDVGYSAAGLIRTRYSTEVLTHFYGSALERVLRDYPGFAFTGELRRVNKDEWYLSTNGPRKNTFLMGGIYLILRNLLPALPKRITYTLTPDVEFRDGEARFMPMTESRTETFGTVGEMIAIDRDEEPTTHFYRRTEEAA